MKSLYLDVACVHIKDYGVKYGGLFMQNTAILNINVSLY